MYLPNGDGGHYVGVQAARRRAPAQHPPLAPIDGNRQPLAAGGGVAPRWPAPPPCSGYASGDVPWLCHHVRRLLDGAVAVPPGDEVRNLLHAVTGQQGAGGQPLLLELCCAQGLQGVASEQQARDLLSTLLASRAVAAEQQQPAAAPHHPTAPAEQQPSAAPPAPAPAALPALTATSPSFGALAARPLVVVAQGVAIAQERADLPPPVAAQPLLVRQSLGSPAIKGESAWH